MRVLFTTPVLEHPAAGGPQLRIENSIKALSRVSELFVHSRIGQDGIGGPAAEQFYRRFVREFVYSPSSRRRWHSPAARIVRRALEAAGIGSVEHDVRSLQIAVRTYRPNVVWFGFGNISFPLVRAFRDACPNMPIVCDTDSVWSRFILRRLPLAKGIGAKAIIRLRGACKQAEERRWVNLCDVTTAVSEVDAEYYRGLTADPDRICIFSNVIDVDCYPQQVAPPPGFRKPAIFLGGTFGQYNSPMDTAARWVLEAVLPIVRRSFPSVQLYIVGRDSDRTLRHVASDNVRVTGKVATVLPFLCNSAVSIVPLKFESGTRFKILEAAACGVPIVSTTLGAEGLPVHHGEHVLVADEPDEFAAAIITILRDDALALRLTRNARLLVKQRFSVEQLAMEAKAILCGVSRRAIAPVRDITY